MVPRDPCWSRRTGAPIRFMTVIESTRRRTRRAGAIRTVLAFTFRHWRRQPALVAGVAFAMVTATLADVFMPFFAGKLVDALTLVSTDRETAKHAALAAFGAMVGLGAGMVVLRHLGWSGIIPLTLRMMGDISQDAFRRVQRFSTDWHANSFSGAVVRKITRGMGALDTLNDTLLLALLPSVTVLLGTMVLMGLHWPVLGLVVAAGTAGYIALTLYLSTSYIAPAAKLSNALDTRLGGMLADAIGCNPVVKAFGAEAREDERLARVVQRWRNRTRHTWIRHNLSGTTQNTVLLVMRT